MRNTTGSSRSNRVRQQIEESKLDYEGMNISLTVSGGVALYPMDGTDWDSLFAVADRRMYAAKSGGRNRVAALERTTAMSA